MVLDHEYSASYFIRGLNLATDTWQTIATYTDIPRGIAVDYVIPKRVCLISGKSIQSILLLFTNQLCVLIKHISNFPLANLDKNVCIAHLRGERERHFTSMFTMVGCSLEKKLDEHRFREQAGFRSKYSTTDHIHAINQLKVEHRDSKCDFFKYFFYKGRYFGKFSSTWRMYCHWYQLKSVIKCTSKKTRQACS